MNNHDAQRAPLQDTLLDGHEVEQTTKLSGRTIQRLVAQGLLPAPFKVGAQNRWSRNAIDAWLAAGCPAVTP